MVTATMTTHFYPCSLYFNSFELHANPKESVKSLFIHTIQYPLFYRRHTDSGSFRRYMNYVHPRLVPQLVQNLPDDPVGVPHSGQIFGLFELTACAVSFAIIVPIAFRSNIFLLNSSIIFLFILSSNYKAMSEQLSLFRRYNPYMIIPTVSNMITKV